MTQEPHSLTFHHRGFDIPADLARMTGGGPETWEVIARGHIDQYERYAPLAPEHTVLELGCGIGRDAIELTQILGPTGRYIGVDIIRPSIEWAHANIAARFRQFEFHHFDIYSEVHNNVGIHVASDFGLPAEDRSVDRVIAQSVFTHIFRADVSYYLGEFERILRPDGLGFVTFFVLDDETRDLLTTRPRNSTFPPLSFEHEYERDVWINDTEHPEGAVAYERRAVESLIAKNRLKLVELHRGYWPGREGTTDGQDIAIISPLESRRIGDGVA